MALPSATTAVLASAEVSPGRRGFPIRAIALAITVALVVGAEVAFTDPRYWQTGWWLALAALLVGALWEWRLPIVDWTQSAGRLWGLAPRWWRRVIGAVLVLAGAGLWFDATQRFIASWAGNFDRAWLSWFGAAVIMSLGFRVLQAPRTTARNKLSREEWTVLIVAFVVAAGFRLANLHDYPPRDGVSQVEELQGGQFGTHFILGDRGRWEFIGPAVLHALGIWFGGPTLFATRAASAISNLLRVVPAYFFFRALAGPVGAMVGAALLGVSGWDTIVSRCSGHPDPLITFCCLALIAGPAVRGLWAAYPWIGLLTGYATTTYIGYRPLVGMAIAGVFVANLARPYPRRLIQWPRVLLATVLVTCLAVAMFIPLLYRLPGPGQLQNEYFNGWNRAHAIEGYYGPTDTWGQALEKRWQRTVQAASLFYTQGDSNPVHNAGGRPLIDPSTAGLMLLGIGYSLVMCLRGFYGLVVGAFAVTFIGTIVATGNFDVLRVQATMTYVYALAAIGAGSFYAAAGGAFGRIGRVTSALLLVAAVLWACYWNVSLLHDLWSSPATRQHYRNDLAYLSVWLHDNAAGRRVIGLIPSNASVVLQENDSSWLRGPEVHGEATWDVDSTLRKLSHEPDPVMLLLFTDTMLQDLIDYFEFVLPGVHFQKGPKDTTDTERMAYANLDNPALLAQSEHARAALCRGVKARFELRGTNDSVVGTFPVTVPFIERASWPGMVRAAAERNERVMTSIEVSWDGDFTLATRGAYAFTPSSYDGTVTTTIDGVNLPNGLDTAMTLTAGPHRFAMRGHFRPTGVEPTARFWWRGPETGNQQRLVPFYQLGAVDEDCMARAAAPAMAEQQQK